MQMLKNFRCVEICSADSWSPSHTSTYTHPGNNTHFSSTAVSRFSACEFHSRSLRENLKSKGAKMEKVMEGNATQELYERAKQICLASGS